MSFLGVLLSTGLSVLGGGAYFALSRHAQNSYRNWEAHSLAEKTAIPMKAAQQVLKGELSLEKLEMQAWEIAIEHGCDFDTACQIRDGQLPLERYLAQQPASAQYPFAFKPVQDEQKPFHIGEKVNEPSAYINATNANTWAYQEGQAISHLLLAGHANSSVCKQISSLIYNTYLGMENVQDSLLVPGACFLQDANDVSSFNIRLQTPFRKQGTRTAQPLKELVGNLQPFVKDTGLATVQVVTENTHQKIKDRIHSLVCQHKKTPVLLKPSRNTRTPHAVLLPFFVLKADGPFPLTFDLPQSIFESEDFRYLIEVHHRALILEMTDDASRRKRIYQKWLEKDQKKYQDFSIDYHEMSDEKKKAKNIRVSGSRDYVNAQITSPSQDGKEVYTSPQETYEKTLPGLLREDQRWIDKMDALMASIKNRDRERDGRLNEMNLAVLIDSFLRGWPPVFLGGSKKEESQTRYRNWCRKKRKPIWRAIHRQLKSRGVRVEPLLEENTIFQIKMINDKVLRFTPLYLTTDQDVLVYLSHEYGVPYYINQWTRRDLIEIALPNKKSNLEYALKHYQEGAKWLDKPSLEQSVSEENAIAQGVKAFRFAIEAHPAVVQEIWNGWWNRFSRDTSNAFDKFKDLMRGFKYHDETKYDRSGRYLKQFINNYPDYLPDPYVLLTIQEQQEKRGVARLLSERRAKANRYTEAKNEIDTKVEFLKSNRALIEKIQRKQLASLDKLDKDDLQKLREVKRIENEVGQLSLELSHLGNDIKELDQDIKVDSKVVWERLKHDPNSYLQKAREIASTYVDKVLEQERFAVSDFYLLRFRPLNDILQGDEYIEIANSLSQLSVKLKANEIQVPELKGKIADCLRTEYLAITDLEALSGFQKRLDNLVGSGSGSISPIVREMILKKEMDQIAQTFLQSGLKKYEKSVYLLPEFTEPLQRLVEIYATNQLGYRKSLKYMLSKEVPLRNFARRGTFTSLNDKNIRLQRVWFDRAKYIIIGRDKVGHEFELAKVDNVTDEEALHLEQELNNPRFLRKRTVGMNTVERVLNTAIAPSPLSRRWSQALQEIEGWLIRVIAYLGILPIPNKPLPTGEFFDRLEGRPIVKGVELDVDRILKEFLEEIGVQSEDVQVIEVDL